MNKDGLFERAYEVRRQSVIGMKLSRAEKAGKKGASGALGLWHQKLNSDPELKKQVISYTEQTVDRAEKIADSITRGERISGNDMSFLQQFVEDADPSNFFD